MKISNTVSDQSGFTLMELVVYITTFSILGTTIGAILVSMIDLYSMSQSQDFVNSTASKASTLILRDARNSLNTVTADATHYKFTTINNETIQYSYSSADRSLSRASTVGDVTKSETLFYRQIDAFQLKYYDSNKVLINTQNMPLAMVRSVQLSFTDSTDSGARTVQFTTFIRNGR